MFIETSCAENGIPLKEWGRMPKPNDEVEMAGNVRELQNTVERSVLLSAKQVLSQKI